MLTVFLVLCLTKKKRLVADKPGLSVPCRFCLVGGLVGVAGRGLVGGLVDEGSLKILLWLVGALSVLF